MWIKSHRAVGASNSPMTRNTWLFAMSVAWLIVMTGVFLFAIFAS
jgi:hypothetical protein